MNKEVKPTWNYILNDLALYSLFMRVAYSEDVPKQDKVDLEHQIKLLQQKLNQLEEENKQLLERLGKEVKRNIELSNMSRFELIKMINQLETNIDEVKEEIKDLLEHWRGNDLVERDLNILLSLLERGKE